MICDQHLKAILLRTRDIADNLLACLSVHASIYELLVSTAYNYDIVIPTRINAGI